MVIPSVTLFYYTSMNQFIIQPRYSLFQFRSHHTVQHISVDCPQNAHPNQCCRNSYDTQLSRPHFVFGRSLHNCLFLLAQIVHSSVIAVCSETDKCSGTYLSVCQREGPKENTGSHTHHPAASAVIIFVFCQRPFCIGFLDIIPGSAFCWRRSHWDCRRGYSRDN